MVVGLIEWAKQLAQSLPETLELGLFNGGRVFLWSQFSQDNDDNNCHSMAIRLAFIGSHARVNTRKKRQSNPLDQSEKVQKKKARSETLPSHLTCESTFGFDPVIRPSQASRPTRLQRCGLESPASARCFVRVP